MIWDRIERFFTGSFIVWLLVLGAYLVRTVYELYNIGSRTV